MYSVLILLVQLKRKRQFTKFQFVNFLFFYFTYMEKPYVQDHSKLLKKINNTGELFFRKRDLGVVSKTKTAQQIEDEFFTNVAEHTNSYD